MTFAVTRSYLPTESQIAELTNGLKEKGVSRYDAQRAIQRALDCGDVIIGQNLNCLCVGSSVMRRK